MNIALVFNKDRPDTIGMYFQRTLRHSTHRVHHFPTQDAHKIPPRYDLYLRIDHGDYKYDIPDHLRPSAFYAIDTHLEHPFSKIQRQARHYDFVFCAQREAVAKLRRAANIAAHWIPVACDPEIHRSVPSPKRFDCGFVGTSGKKNPRGEYLAWIQSEYPESFVGRIAYSRLSKIYSRSRIGFNYSIANDINMRMFEVLASGSLLMTNPIVDNGLEELFETGKHLVTYHDQDELSMLAKKYFKDEGSREKIAQEGYRWTIARHTYRHRLAQMFDIMRRELLGRYTRLTL